MIYKLIKTPQHAEQLQNDLHKIIEWTKTWQMKINVEKCAVLRCTRSLSPILYDYTLASHNIAIKRLHTYLGVGIDSNMTWSSHIQTISNKSTKVLNFLKRNLYNCPPDTVMEDKGIRVVSPSPSTSSFINNNHLLDWFKSCTTMPFLYT